MHEPRWEPRSRTGHPGDQVIHWMPGSVDPAEVTILPPGETRASQADRERLISYLAQAVKEGRLTEEEFTTRSEAAQAARSIRQLAVLHADLPTPPAGSAGGWVRAHRNAPALRWPLHTGIGLGCATAALVAGATAGAFVPSPTGTAIAVFVVALIVALVGFIINLLIGGDWYLTHKGRHQER